MNPHMPMISLVLQSSTDATPVPTRRQAEMYCCKYCSKHGKRKGQAGALYEVLDGMDSKDASARAHFGDGYDATKLGSKLHRAFMSEIGEEMCQCEVAHHANGCPEYFCSRPEKWVHIYKKGLAISMSPASASQWGSAIGHKPSDEASGRRQVCDRTAF